MTDQERADLAMARNKIANAKTKAALALKNAEAAMDYIRDCERLLERIAHGVCPRCGTGPVDSALLGTAAEGHICVGCWESDRAAQDAERVVT